ncbi:hypothetical protein RFI_12055, partial [Reticulomyxa filosa]
MKNRYLILIFLKISTNVVQHKKKNYRSTEKKILNVKSTTFVDIFLKKLGLNVCGILGVQFFIQPTVFPKRFFLHIVLYLKKLLNNNKKIMMRKSVKKLKDLPIRMFDPQCVRHKHEIIICGCFEERACYSYNILKDEYKLICEYPSNVILSGHCVVKLEDGNDSKDSNEVAVLSFGGDKEMKRHTLIMKYVSVWSDDNDNDNEMNKSKKSEKLNNCNEWVPFTDNHNNPIQIARPNEDFKGARALIGGSNNNLLFIVYYHKNISVFNLKTFQYIKHDRLPIQTGLSFPCFVLHQKHGQEMTQKNEKQNQTNNEMLLFFTKSALRIEYDEDKNTFQFHQLAVDIYVAQVCRYGYACVNDVLWVFGGYCWIAGKRYVSRIIFKYYIRENRWEITYVHLIGGRFKFDEN